VFAAPIRGGTLTYGRYTDSLFLDPFFTDANLDIWILQNIYGTLIQTGPDGKGLAPGLATAWNFSKHGKTFTLTLRPGVKFSNGAALTGEDVKFSLNRARNDKHGAWNFLLGSISSVTPKGNQVVIKLKSASRSSGSIEACLHQTIRAETLIEHPRRQWLDRQCNGAESRGIGFQTCPD
jgi:peptide/nickel transport system substrate-binding protein